VDLIDTEVTAKVKRDPPSRSVSYLEPEVRVYDEVAKATVAKLPISLRLTMSIWTNSIGTAKWSQTIPREKIPGLDEYILKLVYKTKKKAPLTLEDKKLPLPPGIITQAYKDQLPIVNDAIHNFNAALSVLQRENVAAVRDALGSMATTFRTLIQNNPTVIAGALTPMFLAVWFDSAMLAGVYGGSVSTVTTVYAARDVISGLFKKATGFELWLPNQADLQDNQATRAGLNIAADKVIYAHANDYAIEAKYLELPEEVKELRNAIQDVVDQGSEAVKELAKDNKLRQEYEQCQRNGGFMCSFKSVPVPDFPAGDTPEAQDQLSISVVCYETGSGQWEVAIGGKTIQRRAITTNDQFYIENFTWPYKDLEPTDWLVSAPDQESRAFMVNFAMEEVFGMTQRGERQTTPNPTFTSKMHLFACCAVLFNYASYGLDARAAPS
jgi:hypothetical protein